jgi:hypothetical protein
MGQLNLRDCAVRLEGGRILHLIWDYGTRIDAENAQAAMDAVNRGANGGTYPLLVDMAGTSFLSNEARAVFAQPSAATRIALLGEGPVDRMLVEYQLSTGPVPCPTRFFTSRADALAWLREPE